jgi:nucleoside-diphosphate-sugar epimerase
MRVFVAGATGAIGRQLLPRLQEEGHAVVATTRTPGKVDLLRELGAEPVVVDGLDGVAVGAAVAQAEPDVVIHQMSALSGASSLRRFDQEFATTNQLRTIGTDHLLAAAQAAGVKRFVVQSYTGWPNARTGGSIKTERDPLDPNPPAAQRKTLDAIEYVERVVPAASGVDGVVLRYGALYGPGASDPLVELVRGGKLPIVGDGAGIWSFLHVADAASATVAALDHGATGVYNVVDDEPAPVSEWLPYLADMLDAKPPRRIPVWVARILAGEVAVVMMTQSRGSGNAKAKAELGWQPSWPTWREGFRSGLS